jgi:hypothetical protein
LKGLYSQIYERAPSRVRGVKVMDEEWDILIVLDACRYDYFLRINDLDGNLEKRHSLGSTSAEWLNQNFGDRYYDDLFYITANPHVSPVESSRVTKFDSSKHLGKVEKLYLEDDLQKKGIVPPAEVTNRAIETISENSSEYNRFVVHYMQPHIPYIGDFSLDNDTLPDLAKEYSDKELEKAYESNLKLVLSEVERLVNNFQGKNIVITADHGECLGEKKIYGHHYKIRFKELVEVPWFRCATG